MKLIICCFSCNQRDYCTSLLPNHAKGLTFKPVIIFSSISPCKSDRICKKGSSTHIKFYTLGRPMQPMCSFHLQLSICSKRTKQANLRRLMLWKCYPCTACYMLCFCYYYPLLSWALDGDRKKQNLFEVFSHCLPIH